MNLSNRVRPRSMFQLRLVSFTTSAATCRRSAWYVSSNRSVAMPRTTEVSFHPRLNASPKPVRVHALTAERTVDVRRIASQNDSSVEILRCQSPLETKNGDPAGIRNAGPCIDSLVHQALQVFQNLRVRNRNRTEHGSVIIVRLYRIESGVRREGAAVRPGD